MERITKKNQKHKNVHKQICDELLLQMVHYHTYMTQIHSAKRRCMVESNRSFFSSCSQTILFFLKTDVMLEKYISVCLYGKIGNWKSSGSQSNNASNSLIRFSSFMFDENVRKPNMNTINGVYIHTWNLEAGKYINLLYQPKKHLHQMAYIKNKVRSQHASIQRCLNLITDKTPMVFVCRIDTVFFQSFFFPNVSNDLWISHLCMQSISLNEKAKNKINDVCGRGKGRILESYHLRRDLSSKRFNKSTTFEYSSFVGDEWFISNFSLALDFSIVKPHKLMKKFREWSHYYWAQNIKHYVKKNGLQIQFSNLKGVSSNLARYANFGVDCVVPQPSVLTHRVFTNKSNWAYEMCPSDIVNGKSILCDWNSMACSNNHRLRIKNYLSVMKK